MSSDPHEEWHRTQAIEANNSTWEWLGLPAAERTADDDEAMTQAAYAASFHWDRAARRGPENRVRADWLLSRVWAVRANGAAALYYADRCVQGCAGANLHDFDRAYAHESRARALACLRRIDEAKLERELAAAVPIADDEDRALVEADLAAEPWFGI